MRHRSGDHNVGTHKVKPFDGTKLSLHLISDGSTSRSDILDLTDAKH